MICDRGPSGVWSGYMVKRVVLAVAVALALFVASPGTADARPPGAYGRGFEHRHFAPHGFGGYGFRHRGYYRGHGGYRGYGGRRFGRPHFYRYAPRPYAPLRRGFY